MHHGNNKRYYLIGDNSFIDMIPTRYWNKKVYEWQHKPSAFRQSEHIYFDVIDNFVLTGTFAKSFVDSLQDICKTVKNMKDLKSRKVSDLIGSATQVTLKLEHNASKAAKLRRTFTSSFKDS